MHMAVSLYADGLIAIYLLYASNSMLTYEGPMKRSHLTLAIVSVKFVL